MICDTVQHFRAGAADAEVTGVHTPPPVADTADGRATAAEWADGASSESA